MSDNIGTDLACTWVIRVQVEEDGQVVQEHTEKNSMMLMYELAYAVLEYKANKMILSLHPCDMLLADNWEPIRHIDSAFAGNIEKNYIRKHPMFDEVKFPFLICSGV